MRRSMVLAAVLSLAVPNVGVAQAGSASVPRDLVLVLLGGDRVDQAIFVGALPAELTGDIPVPEGARVVGGVFGPTSGTVVMEGGGPLGDLLEAFGFSESVPPRTGGGFVATSEWGASIWCREDYALNSSTPSIEGRTYHRAQYVRRDAARSWCDMDFERAGRDFADLTLPSLRPPPGARVQPTGGGGSMDSAETEAKVESPLGLEAIFDHYALQLAEAGWVSQGQALGDGVATGRWDTRDEEGEPVVGTLTIWRLFSDDSHRMVLRMERPDRRR